MARVTEYNKLIAEFMGGVMRSLPSANYSVYKFDKKTFYQIWDGNTEPNMEHALSVSFLSFHRNWNQLMPVVHKIGKMDLDHEPLSNVSLYSPIEEVHKAVVEFIQWYNGR